MCMKKSTLAEKTLIKSPSEGFFVQIIQYFLLKIEQNIRIFLINCAKSHQNLEYHTQNQSKMMCVPCHMSIMNGALKDITKILSEIITLLNINYQTLISLNKLLNLH